MIKDITTTEAKVEAEVVVYEDYNPHHKTTFSAESKEALFRYMYDSNRVLRYCNGDFYKFADENLTKEYNKWYSSLSEQAKFDMYYGDGIVD